jgi:hypothetical protein
VSRERQRGTAWESEIVRSLQAEGFPYAERRALSGARDKGDLTGLPGVVVEAKNESRTDLSGWLNEAHTERDNAGADVGAVWFKRRGKASAGDAYVLMDGATFARLLREAGYGDGAA